ncbi:MAG TPA: hypothetical protein VG271_15245 [Beijerinckiaceae bacterium]|nr:hypothetical protein [Beijerinckiaceae bacterium]
MIKSFRFQRNFPWRRLPLLLAAAYFAALAHAKADDSGGDWKRLTVYIGTTTGGGNDAYARLLARYIGDHLPGHPTVTPVNRPGAGGLTIDFFSGEEAQKLVARMSAPSPAVVRKLQDMFKE